MYSDICCTCKHSFTTGKDRWYCKKKLADKDDCGEYEMNHSENPNKIILTINIPDPPKNQCLVDISLHFQEGQLVEYTAPSGLDIKEQETQNET